MVSGDRVGHEVLSLPRVRQELVQRFGQQVCPLGAVDRGALGQALRSPEDVRSLGEVVHPELLRNLAARVREALTSGPVVVDAALIPEWGIEGYFDLVVFVACPREVRYQRLRDSGRDLRLTAVLEASQLPEEEKRERCHVAVDNRTTMQRLLWRGDALWAVVHRAFREESWGRRLWND